MLEKTGFPIIRFFKNKYTNHLCVNINELFDYNVLNMEI